MTDLFNWSKLYPANYDGYQLFEALEDGRPIEVSIQGARYRLQFEGDRYGGTNLLLVTNEGGKQRRYGWGWESRLVFQALEEMQRGWEYQQTYRYRSLNNVEAL